MNLWVIFITGLTVGGLTCLAVQGGLLASVIAAREEEVVEKGVNNNSVVFPTYAFLVAKLFSYTLLGFFLGAFGGAIGISATAQVIMQLIAGIYMVIIAFNLLNIHPIFRYAVIQPPKWLTRKVRNQSKSKDIFAPALLGVMTIFIPCGTTLAMEALAISSANAFMGGAIMATFVLGTSPLFFGIGWLTSVLGENFRGKFLKIAAFAVIYLGFTSINGAFIALGFPVNSQALANRFAINETPKKDKFYNEIPISQTIEIVVGSRGYTPSYVKVRKGSEVTMSLIAKDAYSCASAFRIPSLGISKNLKPNEIYTINFTPEKAGKITFACSMGMYTGVIEVL